MTFLHRFTFALLLLLATPIAQAQTIIHDAGGDEHLLQVRVARHT